MASSKKSEKLGLSLWESTDRPERLDFVKDNENLEKFLGEHLADALLHLTPDQKEFLKMPYGVEVITGNGSSSHGGSCAFIPKLILMFCCDYPPVVPKTDGSNKLDVYWDFWYTTDKQNTSTYSGGGLGYNYFEKRWIAYERTSPNNSNMVMHMNTKGARYIMVYFPHLS